jgi:hypothetical protein
MNKQLTNYLTEVDVSELRNSTGLQQQPPTVVLITTAIHTPHQTQEILR